MVYAHPEWLTRPISATCVVVARAPAFAQALVACGVIEKAADSRPLFPYDEVRLEIVLKAA
jgi:hypothetical protein